MRNSQKKALLVVENPIHILVWVIAVIALGGLMNLMFIYQGNTRFPTLSSDCFTLIWKESLAIAGILIAMLILRPKRRNRVAGLITFQFDKDDIFNTVYATACYLGIEIAVMVLRNMRLFQVASGDVFAFYLATAVVEELLYRVALIMILQAILAKLFQPTQESDTLILNFICIIVSGSIFALVHKHYYSDPYLMSLTFLGGCSQAFWYLKSKNPLVVIIPHAFINAIAAGSIVQTLAVQSMILVDDAKILCMQINPNLGWWKTAQFLSQVS
jgi:membrane protease YdiL (CAAX protease family)